jgi:hypothetical protein
MNMNEKVSLLVDKYISLAEAVCYDDCQIIDTLLDIFTPEELIQFGYGNFIENYMKG